MKIKNILLTTALVMASSIASASYSYETNQYDHATVGEKFNRYAMVTQWIGGHYNRVEKTNLYEFKYGDGTICRVLVDRHGIVLRIIIVKP